ncbi:MAG: AsmA family protein [Candidatus Binatia bacterium]
MKKALWIGIGLLAVVVVAVLLLPFFIDLGTHKARYLPLVEDALQRKVDIGQVRLRIIPAPSIRISALNVADNPAFSKEAFFTAQQISIQLKFLPLLKGQFQVDEFILEKPAVNLLKKPDGTFNFADMGKKGKKEEKVKKKEDAPKAKEPVKFSELIPTKVRLEGGTITLQTLGQKPLKIQGIDLSLEDFSTERPFPYKVALKPADLKPITLEGLLAYDESRGTLNLKENYLKAQDVKFAVNGTVSNLARVPQVNLSLANDGFETKPIFQLLSAADALPKGMEIAGPLGLRVALTGPSDKLTSQINADIKGLKVNDPRSLNGTIVGKTLLTLVLGGAAPLTQTMRGNGNVTIKDGVLTNMDLVSKIQQITGLIGLPQDQRTGATSFKSLETDFTLGGGIADIKRIFLDSPTMEAQGGGKMTLSSPSLDLGIDVALSPQASARAGSGRAATFFKDSQGRIVVPLKITGPANKPSVNLDNEKLIKKGTDQLLEKGKGQFFERLFRRK